MPDGIEMAAAAPAPAPAAPAPAPVEAAPAPAPAAPVATPAPVAETVVHAETATVTTENVAPVNEASAVTNNATETVNVAPEVTHVHTDTTAVEAHARPAYVPEFTDNSRFTTMPETKPVDVGFTPKTLAQSYMERGEAVPDLVAEHYDEKGELKAPDFTQSDAKIQQMVDEYFRANPNATELSPELQGHVDSYREQRQQLIDAHERYLGVSGQMPAAGEPVTEARLQGYQELQQMNAEHAQRLQQAEAWKERVLAETEKQKEAGWTKEDFLREKMEQGESDHDPAKVPNRTVDEYRAIKAEYDKMPRILPREGQDIPHRTMQVGNSKIIMAEVDYPNEAQNMLKYARAQGMDCICQTKDGQLWIGGDSPAMRQTVIDMNAHNLGVNMPFPDANMTLLRGEAGQMFGAFSQTYEMNSNAERITQAHQAAGIPEFPKYAPYKVMDMGGNKVVIASTQDEQVAQQFLAAAKAHGMDCMCARGDGSVVFDGASQAMAMARAYCEKQGVPSVAMPDGSKHPAINSGDWVKSVSTFEELYGAALQAESQLSAGSRQDGLNTEEIELD